MGLNLWSSLAFLVGSLWLIAWELVGVQRKTKGDTITENWRWLEKWLRLHNPWVGWAWRVGWIGFLGWTLLHFAVGAE